MKRLFLMLMAFGICAFASNAQIIRSTTTEVKKIKVPEPEKSWNHSGFFVDAGIGLLTGDADNEFAVEAGWGYRWHISSGFSWQVLRMGYNAGLSHFSDTGYLNYTTGLRYDSMRLEALNNMSVYGNFNIGYGILTDGNGEGGVAYEIGAGVKLNRKTSVGLFYKGNSDTFDEYYGDYDLNWGMFGVKIEYQFR